MSVKDAIELMLTFGTFLITLIGLVLTLIEMYKK